MQRESPITRPGLVAIASCSAGNTTMYTRTLRGYHAQTLLHVRRMEQWNVYRTLGKQCLISIIVLWFFKVELFQTQIILNVKGIIFQLNFMLGKKFR